MASAKIPSAAVVRQLLKYDPASGRLFWLERGPQWFNSTERLSVEAQAAAWNGRNAGREAFTAPDQKGYLQGQITRYHTTAHRVIWALVYGEWPACIDHIDGDGTNNRLANLRSVSKQDNGRNMAASIRSNVMGVRNTKGAWEAYIGIDGRQQYLGRFHSYADAVAARKDAERQFDFHPNHGRQSAKSKVAHGLADNIQT